MKLILGSANFSKGYGIDKKNFFDTSKNNQLISFCNKNKIKFIDTAYSYNNSNNIFKNTSVKGFKIITKITKENFVSENFFKKKIITDLKILKIKSYYAILFHNYKDISYKNKIILKSLLYLKKKGFVKKIGVSLYDKKEYFFFKKYFNPEVIQIQANVLDRRFLDQSFLKKVKKNKCEIHARSVFLQGLLINNKKPPKIVKALINEWRIFCNKYNINKIEYCLNFLKKYKHLDYLVIGFSSLDQIKLVYYYYKQIKKKNIVYITKVKKNFNYILNPKNWF